MDSRMSYKKWAVIAALASIVAISCNDAVKNEEQAKFPESNNAPSAPDARAIFAANCASCHNPVKDATGPAMRGALARWNNDSTRIKSFIRNSSKMIADGDPYAVKLYDQWNKAAMYSFPSLTDAELNSLLGLMK
jgi:cytochrome c551/c552